MKCDWDALSQRSVAPVCLGCSRHYGFQLSPLRSAIDGCDGRRCDPHDSRCPCIREAPHPFSRLVIVSLLIWVFAAIYSYGSIAEANVLLDRSTPRAFTATVLRKHFSSGRGGTILYLQLGPWGPRSEGSDVTVTSSLYRVMAPGPDRMCRTLARCTENSVVLREVLPRLKNLLAPRKRERMTGYSESAGINRHVVGDARALRERK